MSPKAFQQFDCQNALPGVIDVTALDGMTTAAKVLGYPWMLLEVHGKQLVVLKDEDSMLAPYLASSLNRYIVFCTCASKVCEQHVLSEICLHRSNNSMAIPSG